MLGSLNVRSVSGADVDRPWIAHYDHGVRAGLAYPELTLPQLMDETAARVPDRAATIFRDAKVRYRDLKRRIDSFAGGLRRLGIQPGDRVAVMLPNVPQFPVAFFGALRAGAIVVPTNPLYTRHELEHQLADAGATAIVTMDLFFDTVRSALPETDVRAVIVADIGAALPIHLQPLYAVRRKLEGIHSVPGGGIVHHYRDLLDDGPIPPQDACPDDVAVLQYTGGTTGSAKGAMLTHRNLIANAVQAAEWQRGVGHEIKNPVILCAAPFFHVYGLTVGMNLAVVEGSTMLLIPRFAAAEVGQVAGRYHPQFFPGVPTMYLALADNRRVSARQLSSIEVCISGAAPLPAAVQERFARFSGIHVVEGYGLTEAAPVTHCNPVGNGGRIGTIGVPFPDTDALITDPETWEPLPIGEVGELTVHGPQVMKGYWNRPDGTEYVLHDGWLHTGDMAVMDSDGFFSIVDRKKDVIIASGYNVYPREVEEVLERHPKVQAVAVVGVPNAYRGETVKAIVVPKGETLSVEEIINYCREELAPFKVPTIVEFRDDLPRTLVGKVLRRALREES